MNKKNDQMIIIIIGYLFVCFLLKFFSTFQRFHLFDYNHIYRQKKLSIIEFGQKKKQK